MVGHNEAGNWDVLPAGKEGCECAASGAVGDLMMLPRGVGGRPKPGPGGDACGRLRVSSHSQDGVGMQARTSPAYNRACRAASRMRPEAPSQLQHWPLSLPPCPQPPTLFAVYSAVSPVASPGPSSFARPCSARRSWNRAVAGAWGMAS